MDIAELRKRAMRDPQSLTQQEWNQIFKVAFSVPKQVDSDVDAITHSHTKKQKGKLWW